MKLGEFFIALGVKADVPAVKEFRSALESVTTSAARTIIDLTAVSFSLGEVTKNALDAAAGLQLFESTTGLSAQRLQRWQLVAQQANVSAEAVSASVTALQRNLAAARLGQGNVGALAMLGISPYENAFSALEKLRNNALLKRDPAMASNILSQIGLSPDMVQVLNLSEDKWRQYTAAVHGMTSDQMNDFLKLKETLVQVGLTFKYGAFDFLQNLVDGARNLNDLLHENTFSLKLFAASVGVLAVALAPVTALLVIFLLALEDLAVYSKGGQSLIGQDLMALKTIFSSPRQDLEEIVKLLNQLYSFDAKGLAGKFLPFLSGFNPLMPMGSGFGTVKTLTNSFVIYGEKGEDIAEKIVNKLKEWTAAAEQQIGNAGH